MITGPNIAEPVLSIPLAHKPCVCQNHLRELLIYLFNTHLNNTYYMLEVVTNTLEILTHLILITTI